MSARSEASEPKHFSLSDIRAPKCTFQCCNLIFKLRMFSLESTTQLSNTWLCGLSDALYKYRGFFVYTYIKTKISYGLLRQYWDTGLYEMTYINTSNLSELSQFIIDIALETIYLNHTDNFSTKLLPQHSAKTSRAVQKRKKKKS